MQRWGSQTQIWAMGATLNKQTRHEKIVENLALEPALRVQELSERFDVSSETIRRDLQELGELGLIQRTYGGAVRIIASEPAIAERQTIMLAERMRIAQSAAKKIKPNEILMISGGATVQVLANVLARFRDPITVVTPSIGVAQILGKNPNTTIHLLPGQYSGHEEVVQGAETLEALRRLHADRAFLGASGINATGASEAAIPTGHIYQLMAERATHTHILADSTKYGKTAIFEYLRWGPNIRLHSDSPPPAKIQATLSRAGSEIIIT